MYGNSERPSPLYKTIMLLLGLLLPASMLTLSTSPAQADDGEAVTSATSDVCAPLDSGKIDREDNPESVEVTAPAGKLISGYCVKAGSENSGDGPVYKTLDEPVKTLTIFYPGGKRISHYSLEYVDAPRPPKPEPIVEQLLEERMSCEAGVEKRTGTKTTDWVFDENTWTWVKGTPVVQWNSWTFVRDLTAAEKTALGCVTATPPPPPVPPVVTPPVVVPPVVIPPTDFDPVKLVSANVKKRDYCGSARDRYRAGKRASVIFTVKGKQVREGKWLKTKGATRIVVKAKLAPKAENTRLVGKRIFVLTFNNKPCVKPPVHFPNTGLRSTSR